MGRTKHESNSLRDLDLAARAFRNAERKRDEEIFRAHRAGNSLRVISMATELSHETVRTIIERMRRWVQSEQESLERGFAAMTVTQQIRGDASQRNRRKRLEKLLDVKNPDAGREAQNSAG